MIKKSLEAKKRVGTWIRVSTEDQAKGDSPEHHERRAGYYAESREWDIVEVYRLEAVSGKSVMEHPEAKRMLNDIRRGHISGLVFSKLARLARNTKELLEFADIFRELGADLVSLQESIDTSTPAGRLFYTIIAAMAQWEREEIAERVSASVVVRAKLGKPLNGKIAFGYKWENQRVVPHPEEAPVRRLVYELFLEHRRKKTVARLLNDRGYRTRGGHLFTDTTVEHLIRDPTAKGLHRSNFTERRTGGKQRGIKPESDWVWNPVEAIVSEELWTECNRALAERKAIRQKRPGRRPVHLFAGLAHCTCGKRMYVMSNSPKYVCQACRIRIPIVDLEAIYCDQLKGFFLSESAIADQIEKADQHLVERQEQLRALEGERDRVKQEVDRVYRLYVEGQIEPEAFGKFYKPVQDRQARLEAEVPRLQAEIDLLKIDHLSCDQVLTEAKDLHSRWPSLDRDEKRRVVESITDRIVIGKDDIDISLCYLPSSEEMTKRQRSLRLALIARGAASPITSGSSDWGRSTTRSGT